MAHVLRALLRAAVAVSSLTALGLLAGCSAEATGDELEGDEAFLQGDVTCTRLGAGDAERAGETLTEVRAECLSKQASLLLASRLDKIDAKLGLDRSRTKRPTIVVKGGSCFNEDDRGRYALTSAAVVGGVWAQAKYGVEWLETMYERTNGVQTRWFSELHLCPRDRVIRRNLADRLFDRDKGDLLLETPALTLGVRMPAADRVEVKNARVIADLWASGEHLDRIPALNKKVVGQKLWTFVDPTSPSNQALRRGISAAAGALAKRIGTTPNAAALTALAREATLADRPVASGTFGSCVAKALEGKSPEVLGRVATTWKRELESPVSVEAMSEATVITRQERSIRTQTEDSATQTCFIAIRNAHDIFVSASIAGGTTADIAAFSPYVTVTPQAEIVRNVSTDQRGFVCVTANDYVTVFASVARPDRGLETAALQRALDAVVPNEARACR